MSKLKIIADAIEESNSLKEVTESLSEIAAQKLKRIRSSILQNGAFLNEITAIYSLLKLVAAQRKLRLKKQSSLKAETKLKTASILITSNGRLYGNLEKAVIDLFVENAQRKGTDTIVIGKTGIQFLRAPAFGPFEEIILTHDLPSFEEIKNLFNKVAGYDRVLVYHAKFQSLLTQIPFIKDIKEAVVEVSLPKKRFDFILEPEIDKMVDFFDSQISTLLLEQTFLETELARTAARLVAMDQAQSNAIEALGQLRKDFGLARRSVENIRLLETITASFNIRKDSSKDFILKEVS